MSSFISVFKKNYPQNIEKSDEMTNKFIHYKLIIFLKKNSIDKITHNNLFESQLLEKKIIFITNVMMSQSLDEIEEKNKQNLFRKLLASNDVIISKLADNFKKSLNNNVIYEIRKKYYPILKGKLMLKMSMVMGIFSMKILFIITYSNGKNSYPNFYQNFR